MTSLFRRKAGIFNLPTTCMKPEYTENIMLNKFGLLALGAVLGFGVMASTGGVASAGAMFSLSPGMTAQNTPDGVIQIASKDRRFETRWNRERHGNRCSKRNDRCRHFHDGFYYETPWWTLPLIIGGSIAANRYDDDDFNDAHIEWCLDRYRSYNPRTNLWVAYSGNVYECNSPYG